MHGIWRSAVARNVVSAVLLTGALAFLAGGCGAAGAGSDGDGAATPTADEFAYEPPVYTARRSSTSQPPATLPQVTTTTAPPRPKMAMIGDSLTAMSVEFLHQRISDAGWDPVVIDGVLGAAIPERVLAIRSAMANNELDAIVIALGTNDARLIIDRDQSLAEGWHSTQASAFTALADARAVPCVIWVGVNSNVDTWHLDFWGAGFNAWLKKYTTVADWAARSKGHPEWFRPEDKVHFNGEGADQYAKLVVETLAVTCRPDPPPVPPSTPTPGPAPTVAPMIGDRRP